MDQIQCSSCRSTNPAGFRFCGSCGHALATACPSCGMLNEAGFRFCGGCGTGFAREVEPDGARREAQQAVEERKVVTALFADIEASTELATRLDPEDLRGVLHPFFDAMRQEIERHGGRVEKFIGDAVVAVFGTPVAHEDDPERAVRAALAMQARLRELNQDLAGQPGDDLAMRIGVNTGEVIAATRAGDHEGLVTGETVSLAARLQVAAPSGGVIVGERTYRDTRGAFGYVALGKTSLKGFDRPVPAWRVAPELAPVAGATQLRSPFVGRDVELGLLRLVYRRTVTDGKPSLVTVLGASGIGKSRLAHEFAAEVGADDAAPNRGSALVLRGRCLPYGDGLTYWPLAEMLKSQAGILDSDEPAIMLRKARGYLDASVPLDDQAPGLHDVLLSSLGVSTGTDPLAGTDSVSAHQMIVGAWRRYFEARSSNGPLLAIFEDIHWADPSLLALVEALALRVRGSVLFLCLSRPESGDSRQDWGASLPNATRFALSPLTENHTESLIEHLFDGSAPRELVRLVLERAEGNPFFAGELIRMLREDGTLERRDGAWSLARPVPSSLPDTVQGVIVSRIDLLSPQEKRTIQDAAVVGRIFWHGALERLGRHGTDAIDGLIQRGLVWEREESVIAGDREFIFSHGLTREATYGTIPRARRAEAHAAVATWIEEMTRGRDEEFAELLAHHAEEARDQPRTARYAMLAGHRHRRVFAAEEAIRWYDRAIVAAESLSADSGSLLIGETALSRGEALEQLGRFAEARADYERAVEVARSVGDERGWLEARALAAIVHALWMEDRYDESRRLMPTALERARAAGQADVEVRLLYTEGTVAFGTGSFEESLQLHGRALTITEEIGDLEGEALAHHGLAQCRLHIGPMRDGLVHAERADELLRRLGQRQMLHHNQYISAWLRWMLGETDEADALSHAAVSGCRELGNRRGTGFALTIGGLVALSRGDLRLACESAPESIEAAIEAEAPRLEVVARGSQLYALAEIGATDALRESLIAWLAASERIEGGSVGQTLAFRGWLEVARGATEAARTTFEEAWRLNRSRFHDLVMSLWAEILCWEGLESAGGLSAAGTRLADACAAEDGLFGVWARYALARAALLDGDAAGATGLASEALALPAVSSQVAWRLYAILAAASIRSGRDADAHRHRGEAAALLRPMADALDPAARATFVSRTDVAVMLNEELSR